MKKILTAFFCNSEGKFNPPYFWITILMSLTVILILMRMIGFKQVDNTLVLGMGGFIVGWLTIYNYRNNKS